MRHCGSIRLPLTLGAIFLLAATAGTRADESPQFEAEIAPLLKRHCVKCHGPAKQDAKLNLSSGATLLRGGKSGPVLVPHDAAASLIWQRISADEMPPESPLNAAEKEILKRWIAAGSPGLKRADTEVTRGEHWAFRVLNRKQPGPAIPKDQPHFSNSTSPLDDFIAFDLQRDQLTISMEADRRALIRRVAFDLTGLPPDPESILDFVADPNPDAVERMADRYLASPHFGERMGKVWLDAAGYADSNGYFSADSDRPLAYRYRDYVIRALNEDRPFDQFIREQIAGDEISGVSTTNGQSTDLKVESPIRPDRIIEMLDATHYLRCGQDGTGESDGNPDEVQVDRYTVLETAMQNLSTGLLGLTIQCAKCHDHKFEPLTQKDYYRLQAVLIPAFPPEQWVKPNDRFVYATMPGELEAWKSAVALAESEIKRFSKEITDWVRQHRPQGTVLFTDDFASLPETLGDRWSNTAPGDDAPGGTAAVNLNSAQAPAARIDNGKLQLIEGGPTGDKWLSTRQAFDWTPNAVGESIQVTFDLVEDHIGESKSAERFGYFIALHDFDDNSGKRGGNILIDGHPSSGTAVFIDYPGTDSRQIGTIGSTGYVSGRNYGLRITNKGDNKFLMEHLVDWQVESKTISLDQKDLPDGGFGFEFCCGRSFIVDNVVIESFVPADRDSTQGDFVQKLKSRRQPLDRAQQRKASLGSSRPGKIAWTTDVANPPPPVNVLLRGNYHTPGDPVDAGGFAILGNPLLQATANQDDSQVTSQGTGRRTQFANWLTAPESPRSSLLARVHVNRLWQHHFGVGIVPTADNFGISGAPPSHPELLDWLVAGFMRDSWSTKGVVRRIVGSSTYRQRSTADEHRLKHDPDGRRLSRFPLRRLDAEAIRDAMLAASGDLNDQMYGPYIATSRTGTGETLVPEDNPGCRRRSIYLQQKRTQIHSLLQVFDAPSIVFNSTHRPRSTMPLQSLTLLNSEFVGARAQSLSDRVQTYSSYDSDRLDRLYLLTIGHSPSAEAAAVSRRFLQTQSDEYREQAKSKDHAWSDLSQSLLIGNAALYLE